MKPRKCKNCKSTFYSSNNNQYLCVNCVSWKDKNSVQKKNYLKVMGKLYDTNDR